ncbi:MAG TPA: acyltransferase [Acetobacteraceae bacterium]|nr:acyltransferase [Acetobacteraceae bacterium]
MTTQADIGAIISGKPERLEVLDSVRGIAAFIVVIHHCLLTLPTFSDYFFSTWRTQSATTFEVLMFDTPLRLLWDGYEAVTLFYVLSSLVLALPWVEGRPPTYRVFITKRICRIWLPYLVAIMTAALLASLLQLPAPIAGLSEWLNTMTWSHPVTGAVLLDQALMGGHTNFVNGVVHSLVWEMRVSIIFPLLVLPIVRWRLMGAGVAVVALSAVVVIVRLLQFGTDTRLGLGQSDTFLGVIGKTAYYGYFFVPGALIAVYLAPIRRALTAMPGWLRAGILVAGLGTIANHWTRMHIAQEVMVGIGASILIIAALAPGQIERVLSARPLRWLGEISYSLYLVHLPLLLGGVILLHGVVPLWAILVSVPPLALPLGWAFHRLVAAPSAQLGHRIGRRLSTRQAKLAVGAPVGAGR